MQYFVSWLFLSFLWVLSIVRVGQIACKVTLDTHPIVLHWTARINQHLSIGGHQYVRYPISLWIPFLPSFVCFVCHTCSAGGGKVTIFSNALTSGFSVGCSILHGPLEIQPPRMAHGARFQLNLVSLHIALTLWELAKTKPCRIGQGFILR